MALADVEGARIHLKQLTITHQIASSESLQEILVRHYTRQLLHEMYKVSMKTFLLRFLRLGNSEKLYTVSHIWLVKQVNHIDSLILVAVICLLSFLVGELPVLSNALFIVLNVSCCLFTFLAFVYMLYSTSCRELPNRYYCR